MNTPLRLVLSALLAAAPSVAAAQPSTGAVSDQTRAFFAYEPGSRKYDVRSVKRLEGFELRDISYPSPHGGTVTAFLLVPDGKGPVPAVVYGHWGNGTRASFLPEAALVARAGVVVFIADAPFARALDSFKPLNGGEARETYIQAAVDTRVGLDLLEREPFVDRTRIGYAGLSFGAQIGSILAGVEPRIKAFVLMGGLPSLARTLKLGTRPDLVRFREGMQDKAGFERFLTALSEIDSERFVGGTHAPILFQFGTYDAAIPEDDAREFACVTSDPKEVRWYASGHEFNDVESLNDRLAWLGQKLGFTAPCVRTQLACAGR